MKIFLIEWLAKRLPDCDTTTRIVATAMDEAIPMKQRIQTRLHLWICIYCARYRDQILLLRSSIRSGTEKDRIPPAASLSTEARERMKRRLSQ